MPELPPASFVTTIPDVDVPCRYCARVMKVKDFQIQAYPTAGEQYAFFVKVADVQGWGYGTDYINGELQGVFVCPEHIKQSADKQNAILPRFSEEAKCAACGHSVVDVKHCHGRIATCELATPRLHLHRTCRRCGFSWVEGRLDDLKTKESYAK